MKVTIEVLGDTQENDLAVLEELVSFRGFDDILPGDGFVLEEKEGQPPRIAYLNRRLFRPSPKFHKLIFEVGEPQRPTVKLDPQALRAELQEFVIRKSAAFARPEIAAKELTDFFTKFIGR
jgi:hypothetical protein